MADFVAVHGAGTGGWLFDDVTRRLAAAGHRAPVAMVGGVGALEADVDPDHVDAVLARRGAHPIGTYRQVMTAGFERFAHLPRTFLSCTDKPAGDPLLAQAAAVRRAAGWTVRDIPTGHFAMLSMPTMLSAMLNV